MKLRSLAPHDYFDYYTTQILKNTILQVRFVSDRKITQERAERKLFNLKDILKFQNELGENTEVVKRKIRELENLLNGN